MREVAEKHKRGHACFLEHGHIFDFHHLSLSGRRRICADDFLHGIVELGGGDDAFAVFVHLDGFFEHLKDALLGERRAENDGEIGKWCKARANGLLHVGDGFLRFFVGDIPFIHQHHQSFAVFLNDRENVHVLRFDATGGVDEQDAHVAKFDGADATQHRVVFHIFVHLGLLANAGGVDQEEIEAKLIVARIDAVACGAGNVGHDVALFVHERIHER